MGRHKLLENDAELEIQTTTAVLPEDYAVRLQLARLREVEENAERLSLDNKKKRIDINKTGCNLAYVDVAEDVLNKTLAPIANILKSLDQILATRLNLTGKQTEIVQEELNSILRQISAIEIHIPSTEETDAANSHASSVERDTLMKNAAKARKNRDKDI